LAQKQPQDEKETVMGILLVAFGVAIVTLTIAGVIGFLLGFVGGAIGRLAS